MKICQSSKFSERQYFLKPQRSMVFELFQKQQKVTQFYSSVSNKIFKISIAACAIFVPGPKTPTAPESNKN